jgi:hypothetical protein
LGIEAPDDIAIDREEIHDLRVAGKISKSHLPQPANCGPAIASPYQPSPTGESEPVSV